MNPATASAYGAWFAASLPAWRRFKRALRRPEEAQRQNLCRLLARNAGSAYGSEHSFGTIRSYEEFRGRVPIVDYAGLEPWIARIMRGERAVLTREPVTRLVPTSGSTGGRKLIPFTAGFQEELNAAIGPWLADLVLRQPRAFLGPAYWSVSPAIPASGGEAGPVPVGFDDDSAYLGGMRRRLVEATMAVPSAIRLVEDGDRFRYLTLLCLLRQPQLRLVSVWHPSFFTLLLDALPGWWNELLDDVRWHSDRRRGADLRRVGPGNPRAIWPHLRVVSCWSDAQAATAAANLQRRLPQALIQPKGLLATEAFVSIPFGGLHPLAVTSHLLEFSDERGEILLAHALRPGQRYEVIVTTAGGLWRYRLGDLVEVDGHAEATPSVRFIGRGSRVSDLCGEKLAEIFVMRAIRGACLETGFEPRLAMLAPERDASSRWRYTLFAEGIAPPGLAESLEAHLEKNPHYAWCRRLGQLAPLECFCIERGAERIFSAVLAAEGRKLGDIKPQALSLRTDWRLHFSAPVGGTCAAGTAANG